ncbi:MAG: response regulator transcription factor, partial [Cellulosimicrobium funkei]
VRTVARMLAGDVRAGDALLVDQLVGVVRDRRAVASLTGRETEVLEHLAGGRSVAEIAAALVLSVATVRAHVRSILGKLGVSSQLAASAALARARGGRPVRR